MGRKRPAALQPRPVLGNPYESAWQPVTPPEAESILTTLSLETTSLSPLHIDPVSPSVSMQREKPGFLIGTEEVFTGLSGVSAVIAVQTAVNWVVIEPVFHLCHQSYIPIIAVPHPAAGLRAVVGAGELWDVVGLTREQCLVETVDCVRKLAQRGDVKLFPLLLTVTGPKRRLTAGTVCEGWTNSFSSVL